MAVISAKRVRAVTLAGILCLNLLASSCSHLERIADDLFSDRPRFDDDATGKRIPLPPTTRDFESDLPDPEWNER
jgi:hypothetical protein